MPHGCVTRLIQRRNIFDEHDIELAPFGGLCELFIKVERKQAAGIGLRMSPCRNMMTDAEDERTEPELSFGS
ncbi:hypothetical protein D3C84_1175070 [compost metagenome]